MRAVLVFCEGPHDVAFVQRSLGAHAPVRWVKSPINKLPSPFGESGAATIGFIARRLQNQMAGSLTLESTGKGLVPSFEGVLKNEDDETLYMMLRMGGKDQHEKVLKLLEDITELIEDEAAEYQVTEYAAAFVLDADDDGVLAALQSFRKNYKPFFRSLDEVKHGEWVRAKVPVGCFVFHGADGKGTLEKHTGPMAEDQWGKRYERAKEFVDACEDELGTSLSESKREKALITITGQCKHPGAPLTAVLGRGGLDDEQYKKSEASRQVAEFVVRGGGG